MQNSQNLIRKISHGALIAAVYTAITLMLSPIGFGVVQFRVSEALTMLAIFSPFAGLSVTLGCFMSNLIGMFMGLSSIWDVILGPIATGIAAYFSYLFRNVRIKKSPVLSALMPVVFNAFIIGIMLTVLYYDINIFTMIMNIISVGAGEFCACFLIGLPLIRLFERNGLDSFYI